MREERARFIEEKWAEIEQNISNPYRRTKNYCFHVISVSESFVKLKESMVKLEEQTAEATKRINAVLTILLTIGKDCAKQFKTLETVKVP